MLTKPGLWTCKMSIRTWMALFTKAKMCLCGWLPRKQARIPQVVFSALLWRLVVASSLINSCFKLLNLPLLYSVSLGGTKHSQTMFPRLSLVLGNGLGEAWNQKTEEKESQVCLPLLSLFNPPSNLLPTLNFYSSKLRVLNNQNGFCFLCPNLSDYHMI